MAGSRIMTIENPYPFSREGHPARRTLSAIAKGVRVQVKSSNDGINKREGTIIDGTSTDNWDCIVKIDCVDKPLGFYWQEIIIL